MEETKTSKRNLIIGIIFGAVLLAGVTAAAITIGGSNNDQPAQTQTQNDNSKQTADPNLITFTAEPGETVLAQIQQHADVTVENDPNFGAYVTAINGIEAGTDDKYWTYYVNGEPATIGAAEYEAEGGETIEWKFE
jgi:hypothetical protein